MLLCHWILAASPSNFLNNGDEMLSYHRQVCFLVMAVLDAVHTTCLSGSAGKSSVTSLELLTHKS